MYLNHWALINLPDAQNFTLLIVSFSTHTQRQSQTPLIGTQWQETMGTDWKTRNSISKKDKKHCGGDQALEKVAQARHGTSILWDTQNKTGHSPAQPALSRGAGPDDLQRSLPTTAIWWFFDLTTT